MTNPFKFLKMILKDSVDKSVNRYSTSIEYWERIEHVKPRGMGEYPTDKRYWW